MNATCCENVSLYNDDESISSECRVGDIERVLQWVFAEQRFGLPWYDNPDLSFDKGLTAKPRRRPRDGWDIAKATAGQSNKPHALLRKRPANADANRVMDCVRMLDPKAAALIIKHARKCTRPDWLPGAKPELIPVVDKKTGRTKHKRRGKHRNRREVVMRWTIDPKVVEVARECYVAWHRGMSRLVEMLEGRLDGWRVVGFDAPEKPWLEEVR